MVWLFSPKNCLFIVVALVVNLPELKLQALSPSYNAGLVSLSLCFLATTLVTWPLGGGGQGGSLLCLPRFHYWPRFGQRFYFNFGVCPSCDFLGPRDWLGIAVLILCCSDILYLYPLTFQNHKNFSFLSLKWQVIRECSLLKEQQIHRYRPMQLSFSRVLTSVCLIFNWTLREYFGMSRSFTDWKRNSTALLNIGELTASLFHDSKALYILISLQCISQSTSPH